MGQYLLRSGKHQRPDLDTSYLFRTEYRKCYRTQGTFPVGRSRYWCHRWYYYVLYMEIIVGFPDWKGTTISYSIDNCRYIFGRSPYTNFSMARSFLSCLLAHGPVGRIVCLDWFCSAGWVAPIHMAGVWRLPEWTIFYMNYIGHMPVVPSMGFLQLLWIAMNSLFFRISWLRFQYRRVRYLHNWSSLVLSLAPSLVPGSAEGPAEKIENSFHGCCLSQILTF